MSRLTWGATEMAKKRRKSAKSTVKRGVTCLKFEMFSLAGEISTEHGISLDWGKKPNLAGHNKLRALLEGGCYPAFAEKAERLKQLMAIFGEDWIGRKLRVKAPSK